MRRLRADRRDSLDFKVAQARRLARQRRQDRRHAFKRHRRRFFGRSRGFLVLDRLGDIRDLVGGLRHRPAALAWAEAEQRLGVARAKILVVDLREAGLGRPVEQQGIEIDAVVVALPLANDRDFLVEDIVGAGRVGGDEQNENVAGARLGLDFRAPVRAARHQPVHPDFVSAALLARPQKPHDEAQPADLARGEILGRIRLVEMRVADEDERPGRIGRHVFGALPLGPRNLPGAFRPSRRYVRRSRFIRLGRTTVVIASVAKRSRGT